MKERKDERITPPIFRDPLQERTMADIMDEMRSENASFLHETVDRDLDEHSFFSCQFEDVSWAEEQRGLLFTDVTFNHCDFSNTSMKECVFRRCSFRSCRMTGCDFSSSLFESVSIRDCIAEYANFSGSKMKRFLMQDCRADHSAFTLCSFRYTCFRNTSLRESEFLETSLKDVDLSTCSIASFSVNVENLRGVRMNEEQAAACARLIGIEIVHPSDDYS